MSVGIRTPGRGRWRALTAVLAAFSVVFTALVAAQPAEPAAALDGSSFDPGYIISDQNFFNKDALSEAQIQSFLEQRVPNCVGNNGEKCLKDYTATTFSRPAVDRPGHCSAYEGAANERASRIIYKAAQACGISPAVLLVTLQKEQGLVTQTAPNERQYRVAMGFGCPDTAPCDAQYYGFYNQMYKAAYQFRQYSLTPDSWRYRIGTVPVQYHPNAACGAPNVNIFNQATANLYIYTPYQPNAAALANLTGTGDSCSAYGNRNFWRYYNAWFGSPTGNPNPIGRFESATSVRGGATIGGWAFDSTTAESIRLHVYVDGRFHSALPANRPRGDVRAAYPNQGPNHGFSTTLAVSGGSHEICVYGLNEGPGRNALISCRTVTVTVASPTGRFETATVATGSASIRGWTFDADTASPIYADVYVDGKYRSTLSANAPRGDVKAAYPNQGTNHGFATTLSLPAGPHSICVYGINVGGGSHTQLGCKSVVVPGAVPVNPVNPKGNLESVTSASGGVSVVGWAFDGNMTSPIGTHVYVNGTFVAGALANVPRSDVKAAYPAQGAAHGFRTTLNLSAGSKQVCVYGINVGGGSNALIGCRTVVVAAAPQPAPQPPSSSPRGNLESVTPVADGVVVKGWAFDPDSTASISTHIYVNGIFFEGAPANVSRVDVQNAYPAQGRNHGFLTTLDLPPGVNEVCVYGLNVGGGGNAKIGCANAVVAG